MMIEFLEETHTYLVEGILTPSVTELIHNIYMPNQYSGISKAVLANAADYGNRVHSLVEHWNSTGTTPDWLEKKSYEMIAMNSYISFVENFDITSVSQRNRLRTCTTMSHCGQANMISSQWLKASSAFVISKRHQSITRNIFPSNARCTRWRWSR